ncbi:rust resistance kinase Lr10-like [Oryza glaberrima]|uniref:rust resistance kinase Lr10-like n=1 Tax=Oryza glaberrima TaxID=4538 RepID=UPI00023DEEBE|nr:rust resistance kinase Lr10-like [Oryza glaberrima]
MAIPGSFGRSTVLQVLISVMCVLAVLVPDAGGRRHHQIQPACPTFTCGHLRDVSYPFRRRGDPPECGVASYELTCTDDEVAATILIDNGAYLVTDINYTNSTFWVIDANIVSDSSNNCPLPRWNRVFDPYQLVYEQLREDSRNSILVELMPYRSSSVVFVTCSREVTNNGMYSPVACLSNSSSFVYVLTGERSDYMENLEPSCGYLAMTPVASTWLDPNVSYADVVKLMRGGFAISFPYTISLYSSFKECMAGLLQDIRDGDQPKSSERNKYRIELVSLIEYGILHCATQGSRPTRAVMAIQLFIRRTPIAVWTLKCIAVSCRFILPPLVVLTFLVHKYWKRRMIIDAVEKFLRMQLMIGPTRYAYTDITAITGHFREKLGQGGYGSVYKGVLLPGDVHVAVKVLGNYNCNGEEFISEVSTIGRIHHVNVVRLVGFCAEEMRRALVYEHMPNGSLDKFIFSHDMRFSWDKLNEIALGIARGINYLHQGCEMQILHFDIKPHNILLDSNFVPKVADFGLAKLYPRDNSFVPVSAARGTIGYIAPEMISRSFGAISSKSDVYSFGMLLLEMVGGRRNSKPDMSSSSQSYYPSWVYNQLFQQELGEVVTAFNMHELEKKLCIVGLHCIQMKSHDRPTMSEVIEMLDGGVDGLRLPSRPFFCDDEPVPHVVGSYHLSSGLTEISEEDEY